MRNLRKKFKTFFLKETVYLLRIRNWKLKLQFYWINFRELEKSREKRANSQNSRQFLTRKFLIYINNLPNISEKLFFYLFADDTNIYYESDNLFELEAVINQELKLLSQWLKINRLVLNISKTNFVIFHSYRRIVHHNVTLLLDKKSISEKSHIKYLGVLVDQHLNWKYQISNVSKKISRSIGIMYRLRNFVDLQILKNLYYCLIYSHLIYGIEVWGSACQTTMTPIISLQKRAVRMMTFNDRIPEVPGPLCPFDPLFSVLELLKIYDIFNLQVAKFVYLCLRHETPSIFHDWFTLTSSIHRYATTSRCIVDITNYTDVISVRELHCIQETRTLSTMEVNFSRSMVPLYGIVYRLTYVSRFLF